MPIYEYVCEKCGKLNEVIQKISDPAPNKCDGCGTEGTMSRVVSRTSFVLKGGGWYSDLYSSTKKDASKAADTSKPAAASSTASTSSTTSSAPAAAPASTGGSGTTKT